MFNFLWLYLVAAAHGCWLLCLIVAVVVVVVVLLLLPFLVLLVVKLLSLRLLESFTSCLLPRLAVCDSFIIIAIIILILMSNTAPSLAASPCHAHAPSINVAAQLKILQSRVNNVATATATTTTTKTTPDKTKLYLPIVRLPLDLPLNPFHSCHFSSFPPPLLTDIIFAICHCSDHVFHCPYFSWSWSN